MLRKSRVALLLFCTLAAHPQRSRARGYWQILVGQQLQHEHRLKLRLLGCVLRDQR
ncbi:hypothetical protein ACFFMN_28120 [Planobispora siamensis]|uniref:hypothetical protein n=1 Tax=Planobispora siamensis TaxID=936338 RepID=UPI00194FC95E|nr:hypothetical protein [Planobispora siamensis]